MCHMCRPVDEKLFRPPGTILWPSLNQVIVGAGVPSAAHCSSARPPLFSVKFSGCVVKLGTTVKTSPCYNHVTYLHSFLCYWIG